MSEHQIPTEDQEQAALFEWAAYSDHRFPGLSLMHSIPNGGKRNIVTAANLKRTGVKSGVPDIFLPVARNGKHGLYIELKRIKKSTVSANQKEWISELENQGYQCAVCKGWEAAREVIIKYFKGAYSDEK